jgi:predicted CXXCH cytochrome family protein
MRARWLGLLAFLVVLAPAVALGVDAPHDGSFTIGKCEACHKLHNATGGTLVNQTNNNTTCTVCHNNSPALPSARLGLPWLDTDQAVPGTSGAQHRWDAMAENAVFGAGRPSDTEMLKRIKDGRIQCAACHDVHADVKARDPNPAHTSIAPGVATAQTGGTAGAMTMTLTVPGPASLTKGYRLQVAVVSAGQFELAISHDAGTGAATWWVHNGAWVQGAIASGTTLRTPGTPFALDDGAVQVNFTGTPTAGQFWDFYISSAHLRASNVADAMCLQCHGSRNQTHTTVKGPGNGTTVFSHPVGQALNANNQGYDRAAANVLDADGRLQATGDGNTSNDLKLDAGLVRCTTCHSVHNADSNSLTVDPR